MSIANRDVNTYSQEGRIFQVEYAMQAMNLGTTTIGVRTPTFAILCSEKKVISKLQDPESIRKHFRIYDHAVLGFAGISGDAKTIVDKSRGFCLEHTFLYNENAAVERLLQYLCSLSLRFGEEEVEKKIFSRPFGASILVAGYDTEPRLFFLDPSGSYYGYRAKAIGSGHEVVEQMLSREYGDFQDLEGTLRRVLQMLASVVAEKIDKDNVEIVVVTKDGVSFLVPNEIEKYF
jgi:20S proteasome subunit alpha 5